MSSSTTSSFYESVAPAMWPWEGVPHDTTTPLEPGVEAVRVGVADDMILLLSHAHMKTFILPALVREVGLGRMGVAVFVVRRESQMSLWAEYLRRVSYSTIAEIDVDEPKPGQKWKEGVLLATPEALKLALTKDQIGLWALLVIDNAHLLVDNEDIRLITANAQTSHHQPRIVSLCGNPLEAQGSLTHYQTEIQALQRVYPGRVEAVSEQLSLLRSIIRPKLGLVEYDTPKDTPEVMENLEKTILARTDDLLAFLGHHRHSLIEIYGEEFADLIEEMPDPTLIPIQLVLDYQAVVKELGLWAAERAAIIMAIKVDKLKTMEKYERQYLLLSIVYSEMLQLRQICGLALAGMEEDEKLQRCIKPKVLRLVEILLQYQPNQDDPPRVMGKGAKGNDPRLLHGMVFFKSHFQTKVVYHYLKALARSEEKYAFILPQYVLGDGSEECMMEVTPLEQVKKREEDALKKFRLKEANLLLSSDSLELGVDKVRCNLVVLFDSLPEKLKDYIHCKIKAKYPESLFLILSSCHESEQSLKKLDLYETTEKDLTSRSLFYQVEAASIGSFGSQNDSLKTSATELKLQKALWCLNRFCAKLPSDTFTRLTPISYTTSQDDMFLTGLLLPINSPIREPVYGTLMPNPNLALNSAALKACQMLYKSQELDENLFPTGKDVLLKQYQNLQSLAPQPGNRPGPQKQRHYYYKTTSPSLTLTSASETSHLYSLDLVLQCPIPEDQNTRGRKLFSPERAMQSFGFFSSKILPPTCPFPIYTRSGEVIVTLSLVEKDFKIDENQRDLLDTFHHFTFSKVLRLEKYPMAFDLERAESNILIVPLKKQTSEGMVTKNVDWKFLDVIKEFCSTKAEPQKYDTEKGEKFEFGANDFTDAVVMPWYRNQDQPQYFYVAEICSHLSPQSDFPGQGFETFEKYYKSKYHIAISNPDQPLLDVDHTSARLNFLTPRYVNRKGIALPTSSEETKRNKRDNLEQKQILVPELCSIHPFRASLWRQMVALPCIFYRLNSLLNADSLRAKICVDTKLGKAELEPKFRWEPLDFGWTLADVMKSGPLDQTIFTNIKVKKIKERVRKSSINNENRADITEIFDDDEEGEDGPGDNLGKLNDVLLSKLIEEDQKLKQKSLEIGTWSNEMAAKNLREEMAQKGQQSKTKSKGQVQSDDEDSLSDIFDPTEALPDNLTFLSNDIFPSFTSTGGKDWGTGIEQRHFRVGSPTFFSNPNINIPGLMDDSDGLSCSDTDDEDFGENKNYVTEEDGNVKIEFRGNNLAEAIEDAAEEKKRRDILDKFRLEEKELVSLEPWIWNEEAEPCTRVSSQTVELTKVDMSINLGLDKADKEEEDSLVSTENVTPAENPAVLIRLSKAIETKLLQTKVPSVVEEPLVILKPGLIPWESDRPLGFSFDNQPSLDTHPGPPPSLILQALTMSNANDAINLERLETIGDSFLKYAVTSALYLAYPDTPEGRLSHLRSKQVSNFYLYRLGRDKGLGECMIATKFEPHDNWLPPGYYVPKDLEKALIESGIPSSQWNSANLPDVSKLKSDADIYAIIKERTRDLVENSNEGDPPETKPSSKPEDLRSFVPYNLLTQQSIPDKSIADCVEALIGAYLISGGKKGALNFMSWLGMDIKINENVGQLLSYRSNLPEAERHLDHFLRGFDQFEKNVGYVFRDKGYLLQAFTHTSYYPNRFTDCYQRLEFLGDAVLDYLITRHLYEDPQKHSPGALTDLRSALVNNTIFATLAVKHNFHKFLLHLSPGLQTICHRFVKIQEENEFQIADDFYLGGDGLSAGSGFWREDGSLGEVEDVEVPKALGDVFESIAGAIYLDSGFSLDTVWKVYFRMMGDEIKRFSTHIPKSPIRELLELEPETAKFGKPEKLSDGRRVRVTVDVFGKGVFKGIGRNYRIAKCTAAKCALRALKKTGKNV
ncbi:hypothetical protein TCAL_02552 [Tigriopus californicus]|uniref:ribonuclease III n=1 Tax=Tigriopus californicus TaxID=6832 RepID=A0A553P7V7_TIGCA|nr:endoribonuclease Dcr-1-like [Tigriopus californicus]TRY73759.1 hypothetical protein TCAL_02552 [Tigriopus californicus]|eukprot:TCALIF_02552-PA protein Name:"Similar to dcr-1 Endoribonuclease dcr-1 (Caenorhabditis elegans)" AED:0.03 eAED:0.03 QI:0/-1/0/1/-1/1/1/0/1919